MSERKDEKWLDEQLRRAIDTTKPQFDAEAWKQRYPEAYQALTARGPEAPRSARSPGRRTRRILIGAAGWLAAAAVVVVAVLLVDRGPRESVAPAAPPVAQAPARMVSMMSLSMAFREGGMEALDRQLESAIEKLGPRPNDISVVNWLGNFDG